MCLQLSSRDGYFYIPLGLTRGRDGSIDLGLHQQSKKIILHVVYRPVYKIQ